MAGQEIFSSGEVAEDVSALDESMVTGHQKNPRKRSRYPQARNVMPPVDNRKISQKLMRRDPRLKKKSAGVHNYRERPVKELELMKK